MLNILKKELIDSFRDRRTVLLTVLVPILVMSGLVFFYENLMSNGENETYEVVVQKEQYDFVKNLLTSNENLKVLAVDDVEKPLEEGEAAAGIIIPNDFEQQIQAGNTPKVQILGDENSQNGYIAMTAIQIAFEQFSQSIIEQHLNENNVDVSLLTPFMIEQVQIVEGNDSVLMISFLISIMLAMGIGAGLAPSATDLITGEKERRTMEALLMTPVNRSTLLFAKWLTTVIIGTLIGVITIIIVFVETYFFTEKLKAGIDFGDQYFVIIIMLLVVIISYAALMASAVMVVCIMSKTIKEAQSYSMPIAMIAMFPAMFLMNLGLNEFTVTHFIVPIMNFFVMTRELFYGVLDIQHILLTISSNIIVAAILFFVGRVLFMKDKWVIA